MKQFFTSLILLLICLNVNAQQQPNIYSIYEQQYAKLLQERAVSDNEITDLLKKYSSNNINSDSALTHLLQQLYSGKKDIGILFYFFNNDTLRRAYYKPGKLIEVKYIPIKKDKLVQLGADINQSLNLYQLSSNRTPQSRGNIVLPIASNKTISFASAIKNATHILMPEVLDTNTRHLLIIPALNIGTIPFHLLQPFNDKSYLIDRCSFTIIPSLIDLVGLRTRVLKNTTGWNGRDLPENFDEDENFPKIDSASFILENPLLVSNPAYPADSAFIYPNLPGAEKEIEVAITYAKKYVLLKGRDATKDSVMKYIDDADLAWFATHGIADQKDPMGKSFLVLSGKAPYLTAREIMYMRSWNRKLPEMIILSACQTGLGKSMEAGTAGLARSFILGGSNHVIVSLWNVDDNATAYLMSRFIYHLQSPHRFMPAEPLRLAILDTKKKYKNPSQWASFSLFGIDY